MSSIDREDAPLDIRLGIGVTQNLRPGELIELAKLCEELGYEHLWHANEKFHRDPYVGLTLCAVNTARIKLGTFIADPYSIHPAITAMSVASIDEVSGGRAMLLLGAGGAGVTPLGIPRVKPAKAIGEAIEMLRPMLRGERVTYQGDVVRLYGGKLDFEPVSKIPIYVASRGNLVLAKAGELADGVMMATQATAAGLRHSLSQVAVGVERAGRRLEELELFTRVDCCISDDPKAALEAVRPMVARHLTSSYPNRSFLQVLGLELPEAFEEVARHRSQSLAAANAHLVPEKVVRAFTWLGTPEQVAEQVAAVVDLGIRNITFMPRPLQSGDMLSTVRAFAGEVKPRAEAILRR